MEEALTSLLLSSSGLTALVANRIHWLVLPSGVSGFPYVNLQVVSDPHQYHMGGVSGLHQSRVQIDIWAETYTQVKMVQRELLAAVSGYSGIHAGVNFQGIFVASQGDGTGKTTGSERQLFRQSVDIQISWAMEV